MANSIGANPWFINTAPFSYTQMVCVKNLNITDCTAADHVVIKDVNGNTLVDFTANASQLDYRIGNLGWVRGIVIATGGLGTTGVVQIAVGAGK